MKKNKLYKTAMIKGQYVAVKFVKTAMGTDWYAVQFIGGINYPNLIAKEELSNFGL